MGKTWVATAMLEGAAKNATISSNLKYVNFFF